MKEYQLLSRAAKAWQVWCVRLAFWWCIQALRKPSNTLCFALEIAGSSPEHSRNIMKTFQKAVFLGSVSSGLRHLTGAVTCVVWRWRRICVCWDWSIQGSLLRAQCWHTAGRRRGAWGSCRHHHWSACRDGQSLLYSVLCEQFVDCTKVTRSAASLEAAGHRGVGGAGWVPSGLGRTDKCGYNTKWMLLAVGFIFLLLSTRPVSKHK